MSVFTTTSPTVGGAVPVGVTEIGGLVLDLVGLNGNRIVSQLAASELFVGFYDSGTPGAFNGNPGTIGIQSGFTPALLAALGGGLAEVAVRVTLLDGDTAPGDFDDGENVLFLNGFAIQNFSDVLTEETDGLGTTVLSTTTGFENDNLNTGWFYSADPVFLADFFASLAGGEVAYTLEDVDPFDNFYDFTAGIDGGLIDVTVPPVVVPSKIAGDESDNHLLGTTGDDLICGFGGDDFIFGDDGSDDIFGGKGNDTIDAGIGDDFIHGETGKDIIFASGGNDIIFDSDAEADFIDGGDGVDTLSYFYRKAGINVNLAENRAQNGDEIFDVENVVGSLFDDLIKGDEGKNLLRGLDGNDRLEGREGGDVLFGGVGADQFLYQTALDSTLDNATGKQDVIGDFETGVDKLVLDSSFADISDVVISAIAGGNLVTLTGTDFAVRVKDAIVISDVDVVAI